MDGRNGKQAANALEERITDIEETRKTKNSLEMPAVALGQNCPSHCLHPDDQLGEPLDIREVAKLIGSSVWTVRQRYLPSGLPHLRLSPRGKLVFYRHQVIRWVLERQQKGGTQWPSGSAAGLGGRRSG
ncbi:MAG TPA: hypothetical protein VGT24_13605 [Candidatus Acidoferrales bacterium]|nr:hypothetical protein [Candidatus Acidoferrales bacterium]